MKATVPPEPGSVTLLLNHGLPQKLFAQEGDPIPAYPMGTDSGNIAIGDLDGDCKLDMVVANLGSVNYVDPKLSKPTAKQRTSIHATCWI